MAGTRAPLRDQHGRFASRFRHGAGLPTERRSPFPLSAPTTLPFRKSYIVIRIISGTILHFAALHRIHSRKRYNRHPNHQLPSGCISPKIKNLFGRKPKHRTKRPLPISADNIAASSSSPLFRASWRRPPSHSSTASRSKSSQMPYSRSSPICRR